MPASSLSQDPAKVTLAECLDAAAAKTGSLLALSSTCSAGRELAQLYRASGELTDAELERAAELVEAAGGRAWAEREATRCAGEALPSLEAADLLEPARERLAALTRMISGRDR